MRKSVLAALMAATVLVPAAASAQDDQGHHGHDRGEQQRPQRPQDEQRGGGANRGAERPQPQVHVEGQAQGQFRAPAPSQPQGEPQARQFDPGGRGGRPPMRGNPDAQVRGDYRSAAPAPQPQVQQQQGQPGRPDGDRGGTRSGERPGWRGGNDARQYGDRSGERPGWQGGNDPRRYDNRPDGRPDPGRGDPRAVNNGRGGYDQRAYGGYNGGPANRGWNRDWRRNNQYNYLSWRNQNRDAFHLPRYYAPYGWGYGYRRFSIGFSLSSILYAQDYWIDDPDYYRLPPAYGPYRWVRYYNDALLVDVRTGYVVDTVYDIFW